MALSIAIASTAYSAYQTGQAAQASTEALGAQKRTQELETRRASIKARNEARQARASALATGTNQGAGAGSGVAGVLASIGSSGAAEQTYLGQAGELSGQYFNAKIRETIFSSSAATFGSLGNLGFSIASDMGVFSPSAGKATTGAGSTAGK